MKFLHIRKFMTNNLPWIFQSNSCCRNTMKNLLLSLWWKQDEFVQVKTCNCWKRKFNWRLESLRWACGKSFRIKWATHQAWELRFLFLGIYQINIPQSNLPSFTCSKFTGLVKYSKPSFSKKYQIFLCCGTEVLDLAFY